MGVGGMLILLCQASGYTTVSVMHSYSDARHVAMFCVWTGLVMIWNTIYSD